MKYWVNVTKNCNLHCQYCYQKDYHQATYMNKQVADQIIDFIIREGANNPSINFFGGEALLNFGIIRYIVTRLVSEGVKSFATTTNLVALTNEMVDFFEKYRFSLLISLDGTKESHDKNRVTKKGQGTFKIVMKNLQKLKARPHLNLRIAKVLTIDNFLNFYNDYLFLKKLELPVLVNVELDGLYLEDETLRSVYKSQIEQVFSDYLKSKNFGQFPFFHRYYKRYLNFGKDIGTEELNQAECTRADTAQIVFDPTGRVHPCHMMVEMEMKNTSLPLTSEVEPIKLKKDLFQMNELFRPLTDEEVYSNLDREIRMKGCNSCKYIHSCLKYMLLHAKNSCIFKRYSKRIVKIDDSKGLLCFTKLVLEAIEKHAMELDLGQNGLRGDDRGLCDII